MEKCLQGVWKNSFFLKQFFLTAPKTEENKNCWRIKIILIAKRFFLAAPENETWKLFPRKQFSWQFPGGFSQNFRFWYDFSDFDSFSGLPGSCWRKKLFCKQKSTSETSQKVKMKNCFEFRKTIIFRRTLMIVKIVYQNTLYYSGLMVSNLLPFMNWRSY